MRWKVKIKMWYTLTILSGFMTLAVGFYPMVSDAWNRYVAAQIIYDYTYKAGSDKKEKAMYKAAVRYNTQLYHRGLDVGKLSQEYKNHRYEAMLNLSDNTVMGYLTIDTIHLSLPIYHYATEDVLSKGIGHLYGTSLPVGGLNTHSVLTGHCGLAESKLFTDLDQLDYKDIFSVTVLGKTLYYEIDQIKTVLPNQLEDLAVVKGMDYITLLTCTPYGINTHRLLVRGHRISNKQISKKKDSIIEKIENLLYIPYVIFALCFFIMSGTLILIFIVWRK